MSDEEFFRTPMGRQYYDRTMPRIADALERLATVLENEGLTMEAIGLLKDWAAADLTKPTACSALLFRTRALLKPLEPKK